MSPATLRTHAFIARCAVIGLAAAFLLSVLAPGMVSRLRGNGPATISRAPAFSAGSSQGPVSYADAVARASPAVVNIYANKVTTYRPTNQLYDPLTLRLLGYVSGRPMRKLQQNRGSGVIFSNDGYVLTNNHVISGADDIQVLLDTGAAHAQVVGTDAETDLAVLKIDAGELPTIDVADDADVNVGDVVLAIGNPVGIGKTVTMGIVSANRRQLRMSQDEDFIQTDAAINAGNRKRFAHHPLLRCLLGVRDVRAVRIGGEADHFGERRRAPRQRMLQLFQHQKARTFADDEHGRILGEEEEAEAQARILDVEPGHQFRFALW
jgi:serine protease DegS/serine protease DegQ